MGLAVSDAVTDAVAVPDCEPVRVLLGVRLCVGDGVCVTVCVPVTVRVMVWLPVEDAVELLVCVVEADCDGVGVSLDV